MPHVGKRHFPYTTKGKAAAKQYAAKIGKPVMPKMPKTPKMPPGAFGSGGKRRHAS